MYKSSMKLKLHYSPWRKSVLLFADLHCIPTCVYVRKKYYVGMPFEQENSILHCAWCWWLTSMANHRSAIYTNCLILVIFSYYSNHQSHIHTACRMLCHLNEACISTIFPYETCTTHCIRIHFRMTCKSLYRTFVQEIPRTCSFMIRYKPSGGSFLLSSSFRIVLTVCMTVRTL